MPVPASTMRASSLPRAAATARAMRSWPGRCSSLRADCSQPSAKNILATRTFVAATALRASAAEWSPEAASGTGPIMKKNAEGRR